MGFPVQGLDLDPELFDAVVDPTAATTGGFTYALPSAAFAAGAKRVWVRAGTYVETADIVIPERGALMGEAGVTIVLGAHQVTIDGSGRQVVGGTIAATNGSTTVVGTGTTFTGLVAGDWISLRGVFHQIASVTDDLALELLTAFQGLTFSGIVMFGQSMLTGASIRRVVLAMATGPAIEATQAQNLVLQEVLVGSSGAAGEGAVQLVDSGAMSLTSVVVQDAVDHGFRFVTCKGVSVSACGARNCAGHGFRLEACQVMVLDACIATHCDDDGYRLDGDCSEIEITDSQAIQNAGDGFHVESTAVVILFGTCHACTNGGDGFRSGDASSILSGCFSKSNGGVGILAQDYVAISGCYVAFNVGAGIDAEAAEFVTISGGVVRGNLAGGVRLGDKCRLSGVLVVANALDGVLVPATKDENAISGCTVTGNTGDGVEIAAASCDDNLVVGNQLAGNTGTNLLDSGTGTLAANNKT